MILLFYHIFIFHRDFFRQRHVLSVVMLSLYFTILSLHFDRSSPYASAVNRKMRLNAEIGTMADMTFKIELIFYMQSKFQPGV